MTKMTKFSARGGSVSGGNKMTKLYCSILFVIFLIYFLHQIFAGYWILPQTFNVGPVVIHYYGLIMALAVACAFYLAIKRAPEYGVDIKQAEDILFWLIIGGFIGARLYHVLSSFSFYYANPADIIKVWNGGLSIYGAVIAGFFVLLIVRKLSTFNLQLLTVLDWLAPSLVLGQIIGRFGNLFNYEAFGYPTNLPWKMFVPFQFRPLGFESFNYFHPFFLYEALGNLVIFFLLLKIIKPKNPGLPSEASAKEGVLFFSYLLLYNILRFGLEFLRIDSTFIHGVRLNAAMSFLLVAASSAVLAYINKRKNAQAP
jgi:phosphatidylglycerol:prolipoprotein diacylglycerol transferase